MIFALIAATGYLLGSIPFGLLAGRAKGIDIRQHGSGNIGATNVFRTLGKTWGILVFVCDFSKGAGAVCAGIWIGTHAIDFAGGSVIRLTPATAGILSGMSAILGHNFPVWLKFKGGKGIATSAGVLVALMPWATLVCFVVWALVFFASRYVSLASVVAAAALPAAVWALMTLTHAGDWPVFFFSIVIATLAIWRHRPNIQRLIAGTESRFGKSKSQP